MTVFKDNLDSKQNYMFLKIHPELHVKHSLLKVSSFIHSCQFGLIILIILVKSLRQMNSLEYI